MQFRPLQSLCLSLIVAALLLVAPAVGAPSRRYNELVLAGDRLMRANDLARACGLFKDAVESDPAEARAHAYLAECYQRRGQTASARDEYEEYARRMDRSNPVRARKARAAAAKLVLTYLTVSFASSRIRGLRAQYGKVSESTRHSLVPPRSTFAIDPGEDYTVEATAPDREPWRWTGRVPPTGSRTVQVPDLTLMASVTISVEPAHVVDGLVVHCDGQALTTSQLGLPRRLQPGEHRIDAVASGRKPWSTTIDLGPDEPNVRVEVPLLEQLPPSTPDVYTITIATAQEDRADLVVLQDGKAVERQMLDGPIRVGAGAHTIKATAVGKAPWSIEVTVGDDNPSQVVRIPPLEDLPDPGRGARVAGGVLLSLGLSALAVSVVTGVLAGNRHRDAAGHCASNGYCDQAGYDAETKAGALANATTGLIVGGSILTLPGIIILAAAPARATSARADGVGLRPVVQLGWGRVSVRGVF